MITKRFKLILVACLLAAMFSPLESVPLISGKSGASIASAAPLTGACPNFTDLNEDNYFCLAVKTLVSAGSITGYALECASHGLSAPCFLPNNDVSRGEFSKMLVATYGWPLDNPGTPTFSDVPVGSTFYRYIETAYSHQVMGGYSNPQCSNAGLAAPCFFPYNNVTRGQMAKMVSNAASYTDSTAGRDPSYADVGTTNPFFTWIERLVMHAAVGPSIPGCGSTSLPCFFPSAKNATRAESALYIYLTTYNNNYGQVLTGISGTYTQLDVYITTPDAPVSGNYVIGAPVGVTNRWNGKFIESGPHKDCSPNCELHPYGAWGNVHIGNSDEYVDRTITLSSGGSYQYKSVYFGGTGGQWQSQFCSSKCIGMITSGNIGTAGTSLPYVVAGGESTNINQRFGVASILSAQAYSSSWNLWCFDPTFAPWRTLDGYVSSCINYGWTVIYP